MKQLGHILLLCLLVCLSGCGVGLCINEQNCSSLSNTPPPTFVSLSAVELTAKKVTLSWTPWTGSGNRYSVYYSTTPNLSTVAEILLNGTLAGETTDASLTITDFTFDQDYYFNVIATETSGAQVAYTLRSPYCGGTGTLADPYQVCDPGSLQLIELHLSSSYLVTSDIDLSGTTAWNSGTGFASIGGFLASFSGVLDGGEHTIDSFFSTLTTGLFYFLDGAAVSQLTISNANVLTPGNAGILAGFAANGASVHNVHVSGRITSSLGTVGGLIGSLWDSSVMDSSSTASVYSSSGSRTGGLIGETAGGTTNSVLRSFASGNVVGFGTYVGGLIGFANGSAVLEDCYATGNVYGDQGAVGGLAGALSGTSTIRRSYALGNVLAVSTLAGGLLGGTGGTTENSFAVGNVSAAGNLGGLSGQAGTRTNVHWFNHPFNPATCYSVGDVNCTSHTNPTWFYDIANYDGGALELDWDFSSTGAWMMPATGKYPVLRWQNPNRPIEFPPEFRNGRKIGYSDMAAYRVWGFCGTPGETISFGGPNAPANTTCNGGTFTTNWDFSAASDGSIDITVQQGTSPVVQRRLVKDTAHCNATTNADIAAGAIDTRFGLSAGPHTVCNVQQLSRLQANSGNWSKSFVLGNNIDLAVGYTNSPIGVFAPDFTGSFDGDGFVLSNLTMALNDIYVGFIGNGNPPSNLGIENADVRGFGEVGALLGVASILTTVTNCYSTGFVGYQTGVLNARIGGLVGRGIATTIDNSFSTADVLHNNDLTGGLAGDIFRVTNSFATGNVRGRYQIGGLAGYSIAVSRSYATGNVSAGANVGASYAGGLVGWGSATNSYATGSVYCQGRYCGGLLGYGGGNSEHSYATGNVFAGDYAGGLVGYHTAGGQLNSFGLGSVYSPTNAGFGAGTTEAASTFAGYYHLDVPGNPSVCSGAPTTATVSCSKVISQTQFYSAQSPPLSAWDFSTIWKFPAAGGLPILQWQEEAP